MIAIRFEYDDVSYAGAESVQGYVYGFDTERVDLDGTCDVIGTWTDDDRVKLIGLTPVGLRPLQTLELGEAVTPLEIELRKRTLSSQNEIS